MSGRTQQLGIALVGLLILFGCDRRPAPVELPRLRPDTVATAALKQCDANGDGFIDQEEAKNAPGLQAGWKRLDTNGDGKVSAEEISARIQFWLDSRLGAMTYGCAIQYRGKPLEDAIITFDPEPFLGGTIPAAEGITGRGGATYPRPMAPGALGMPVGFYRVRISKLDGDRETIPTKYNSETTIGVEVAGDVDGVTTAAHQIVLE